MLERSIGTHKSSSFSEFVIDLVEGLVDLHSVETELHQLISGSIDGGPEHFRGALRAAFERATAGGGSVNMNRILFVLPSLVEGVVHGVTSSPFASREAKGEAVRATRAYLSAHPELGR
jgi:hypothetical protein